MGELLQFQQSRVDVDGTIEREESKLADLKARFDRDKGKINAYEKFSQIKKKLELVGYQLIYHNHRCATAEKAQKEKDLKGWEAEFETVKDQITGKHEVAVNLVKKDVIKQRKKLGVDSCSQAKR